MASATATAAAVVMYSDCEALHEGRSSKLM